MPEILREASREASEQGYHFGVLGASEMGEGVYRQLGFEQYCLLQMYEFLPDDGGQSI
jgi:predicted acetyltransferase